MIKMKPWENLSLDKIQEVVVNGGLLALGLILVVGVFIGLVFKFMWEYLWLVPFFIVVLLQMIMMSLVWLMLGLGTLVMYVKDLVPIKSKSHLL